MSKVRITQTRSLIGRTKDQRATVRALGLRKIRQTVEHNDSPEIRGMINKVSHLIETEEVKRAKKTEAKADNSKESKE